MNESSVASAPYVQDETIFVQWSFDYYLRTLEAKMNTNHIVHEGYA